MILKPFLFDFAFKLFKMTKIENNSILFSFAGTKSQYFFGGCIEDVRKRGMVTAQSTDFNRHRKVLRKIE